MRFLKIAILFIGMSSLAQGKVGAVDIDYILGQLPETATVQQQMELYGNQLDVDLNKKVDQYKKLVEAYQAGEATFSDAQKKEKQTELIELEQDIQKFQQNGAKLMDIKQQEYLKPIYQKIGSALEKVAKAQNYTQVLQTNDSMVYLDPNYDLTILILNELGVLVPKE